MTHFGLIALAIGAPLAAQAAQHDGVDFFFQEALGGVYTQDWGVYNTGAFDGISRDVYVQGTGKSGDFWGVLSINCDEPQYSAWKAVGGVLQQDRVPDPVIAGARGLVCEG